MPSVRSHDRRHLFLIPLAALIAVLPLILHGCSCGHDFDFHVLSWLEAATQFRGGNVHPHWAFTPAFNAGEPRFVFYPPISWMLGALLGLLLTHLPGVTEVQGWTAAPILFTWISLTASGFTFRRLAREFVGTSPAVLAAVLYLANPYMLFTAYERTAYAELLAAAWFPLLLLAILRPRLTVMRVAVPVALLWLTNAPAGVMGTYALALLALVRLARTASAQRLALAGATAIGTLLGFALTAFYLVPAIHERPYVQLAMAVVGGMRVDDNTLFHRTGFSGDAIYHDQVLHTASTVAVLLLLTTAAALITLLLRRSRATDAPRAPLLSLCVLTAAVAFALTPASLPLWHLVPQAAFLQFPWRLLALLATAGALAIALVLDRYPLNIAATAIIALSLAVALVWPAILHFGQRCDPEDAAAARVALFHSTGGTDPTDEYTPTQDDNDALPLAAPPYWLAEWPDDAPPASTAPGQAPNAITIDAGHVGFLILNRRDYPAWRITRNGTPVANLPHRNDGLIALPVPAGPSSVEIAYAQLPDQDLGDGISVLAMALCGVLAARRHG
jgi:hypothetical protein